VVLVHVAPFIEFWEKGAWDTKGEKEWGRFVRELYAPSFAKYGVDMVISGHSHIYQRGTHDGIVYLITGGGGGNLERYPQGRVENYHFYEVSKAVHHYGVICIGGSSSAPSSQDQTGFGFGRRSDSRCDIRLGWTAYDLQDRAIDTIELVPRSCRHVQAV
jgi:hypothetical protein